MTESPLFLDLADVMAIHAYQVGHFGGSMETREEGLLESAIAMPQMSFGNAMLHRDVFEMAAAYLFHIVQNHPFVDGNKRTGAMSAVVFLDVNGIDFDASDDDFTAMVVKVASGKMKKNEIAAFLKSHGKDKSAISNTTIQTGNQ